MKTEKIERENVNLNNKIKLAISNHTPEDLAIGYLRYEAVRRMNPRTFSEIWRQSLRGISFDDIVDGALWWNEPKS